MSLLEEVVRNEELADALASLALSFGYPTIDRLYSRYRFDVIRSGELMRAFNRLIEDGVLVEHGCAKSEKGPNWKEPAYMSSGKYSALIED